MAQASPGWGALVAWFGNASNKLKHAIGRYSASGNAVTEQKRISNNKFNKLINIIMTIMNKRSDLLWKVSGHMLKCKQHNRKYKNSAYYRGDPRLIWTLPRFPCVLIRLSNLRGLPKILALGSCARVLCGGLVRVLCGILGSPPPIHFFQNHEHVDQRHENYCIPIHFLWFWSQPLPSHPLPKPWKWWQSYAFLMILEPTASLPGTLPETDNSPMHFFRIPKPATTLLRISQIMKMLTVLCISDDLGARRSLPGRFQNHENQNRPMHFLWLWLIMRPAASLLFTSKTVKTSQSHIFLMILKPISPLPPTSKDMKMMMVFCIPYDSEASRRPPTHFQNHENVDSPMHFLW